jgi:predicted nucleotidyltransferase component of viral defense system
MEGFLAKGKKPTQQEEIERLDQIKKLVIIAVFSDNELMDRLVLKGGNALDLLHKVSARASVDIDFSMENDFDDEMRNSLAGRLQKTLQQTFTEAMGLAVFDLRITERPPGVTADVAHFWGGYLIEFKLAAKEAYDKHSHDVEQLRRHAITLGQGQKFTIDISKHEYTTGKVHRELDNYRIFLYSLEMIACEKLRAICQQMKEYGPVVKRNRPGSSRARDFLDIYTLVTDGKINLTTKENRKLLSHVFAAKKVPLTLLRVMKTDEVREFHRHSFDAVKNTVKIKADLKPFDFYADFVVDLIERLEPLGDV